MAVSYNKLWKLLVDKKMSKADLRKAADIAPNTMTKLNRDINNRFYTLLTLWFYGTDEETKRLEHTLNFLAKNYGNDWDKAERVELLMWRYDSAP